MTHRCEGRAVRAQDKTSEGRAQGLQDKSGFGVQRGHMGSGSEWSRGVGSTAGLVRQPSAQRAGKAAIDATGRCDTKGGIGRLPQLA